ncbi:MAG: hypothetical protein L6408_04035, partial [Nanoarchaeota archaeon]|nr:hypothetical protein [Nanoarchaeota archaeon]
NVTYSAESNLHPELSSVFKDLVIEADALMKKYNGGSKLGLLLNKESYQLQDILAFYTIIEKQDYFDGVEKEGLSAKLIKLREAKMGILDSRENRDLFNKIEEVSFDLKSNSDKLENFEKYFSYRNLISRFEKEVGNFNNDWMHSFIKSTQIEGFGLEPSAKDRFNALELKEKEFDQIQEEAISELQQYLNLIIFDNQLAFNLPAVEDIGNPAAKKFPWWLGSWVIGCGAPILRNLLIKGYTRGSNVNDEAEYVGSAMAGFGNGLAGLFFIDGLAPWVFPARMLSPLILQPAFKLMKWDPARGFSKGW